MTPPTFSFEPPHVPTSRSPGAPAVDLVPLREVGDDELVVELAQLFVDSTIPLIATIREAMARADSPSVVRAAHSVKGAAANLYAERLRAAACSLEAAGKRGEISEMLTLVEEVDQRFGEARDYLKTELNLT